MARWVSPAEGTAEAIKRKQLISLGLSRQWVIFRAHLQPTTPLAISKYLHFALYLRLYQNTFILHHTSSYIKISLFCTIPLAISKYLHFTTPYLWLYQSIFILRHHTSGYIFTRAVVNSLHMISINIVKLQIVEVFFGSLTSKDVQTSLPLKTEQHKRCKTTDHSRWTKNTTATKNISTLFRMRKLSKTVYYSTK